MTENTRIEDAVEPKTGDVVDDMSDRTEQTDEQDMEILGDSAPTSASAEQAADMETDTVSDFDWGAAQAIRLAEARRRRKAAVREAMEYVQSIALAILLAVVIMTFVGRSFVVEGASMEPTLHNRERIIVEKVSYRFRAPARGDIIVLRNPWRPDTEGWARAVEAMRELVDFSGSMRPYIKRIIGVGGDTIEISDGRVYLNGKELHEPYVAAYPWSDYGRRTVPEGHVFVMGDNRNNSDDSRGSVGFLRIDRIVGRAVLRYYPLNKTGVMRRPDVY
jgi:signal peptidase I